MVIPSSNGKTLLVTGINGYIASNIGYHLLRQGYSLRGTARQKASTKALTEGAYAEYSSRVSILEVPDITRPGAFDEAVEGVHGILHTASPSDFTKTRFEDFVIPAVEGTRTILDSALKKAGPQLESVVVTSSVRAVMGEVPVPGKVYTESDQPTDSLAIAETDKAQGRLTPVGTLYGASKIAAEREVWKFRDELSPPFSLATILPAAVIGPPINPPISSDALNETLRPIWKIFSAKSPADFNNKPFGSGSFVDVRDVAQLHVWAVTHPSISANQRYLASAGFMPPQAVADILRCTYPENKNLPIGEPGEGYVGFDEFVTGNEGCDVCVVDYPEGRFRIDARKAEKAAGIEWKCLKDSVVDTAKVLERYL